MNRAAFLQRVHELAEQLGRELYTLVQKQSERARAQALELAKDRLRAELEGRHEGPDAVEAEPEPRQPARTPRRKSGRPRQLERTGSRGADHPGGAVDRAGAARAQPRARQRCSKCVAAGRPGLGHNAKTCGREPAATDSEEESPAAPVTPHAGPQAPPLLSLPPRRIPTPPREHRVLRAVQPQVPPPGWTPELDRVEEFADLSVLAMLRVTS